MNKMYRLVWSHARNMLVVAAETAASGKSNKGNDTRVISTATLKLRCHPLRQAVLVALASMLVGNALAATVTNPVNDGSNSPGVWAGQSDRAIFKLIPVSVSLM